MLCKKDKKKVGVITWHYYINFGSGLQAFATAKILSDLGYESCHINYRDPVHGICTGLNYHFRKIVKTILSTFSKELKKKYSPYPNVLNYQNKYLKQTKAFQRGADMTSIIKDYYALVYGSDQIWAPNCYNSVYMGDFVPDNVKKISYAASIGLNDIPANMIETYKKHLSAFHAISVREEEGKQLLKQKCGLDAAVVLDPTLMLDVEIYRSMQAPIRGINGKYLFCYFLNPKHRYQKSVEEYANKNNLQIIGVSDNLNDASWMRCFKGLGADQFLWLINHAETIFTDSYHGSIFSLLFHKNLWTFVRFAEDNPICQNSRIRQLSNNFNLSHRIINEDSLIDDSKAIDYNFFECRLAELRHLSLDFLIKALG